MVPVKGQHPLFRDVCKGGYQRRAGLPDCREERLATRSGGAAVCLSGSSLTPVIHHLVSYVDYPDPIQLDAENSQNYGCNC